MKKRIKFPRGEMAWSFAIVNGRQAEIFFVRGKGIPSIYAHAYHDGKEKWTKIELRMIKKDLEKNLFSYRKDRKQKYRLLIEKLEKR